MIPVLLDDNNCMGIFNTFVRCLVRKVGLCLIVALLSLCGPTETEAFPSICSTFTSGTGGVWDSIGDCSLSAGTDENCLICHNTNMGGMSTPAPHDLNIFGLVVNTAVDGGGGGHLIQPY